MKSATAFAIRVHDGGAIPLNKQGTGTMRRVEIRAFQPGDAGAVNALAVSAFQQFAAAYADWPAMSANLKKTSSLASVGELIVADTEGRIAGCVVYIPPHQLKAEVFEQNQPIIRMLVVHPDQRGQGVGRALTGECLARARRDGADRIALHTSPIMDTALGMYFRMGFEQVRTALPIFGVPYHVYVKRL